MVLHDNKPRRVMWLLNHTERRKFEVPMLKSIGIDEIFTPKKFPSDIRFIGASVSYEYDSSLSIPPADLERLNDTNWYKNIDDEIWDVVNLYFDVIFFLPLNGEFTRGLLKKFNGIVVLRECGTANNNSYGATLDCILPNDGRLLVRSIGKRFFFSETYSQPPSIEHPLPNNHRLHFPLGIVDAKFENSLENCLSVWQAGLTKIYSALNLVNRENQLRPFRPPVKKIAIIIPVGYGRVSLREPKLLAQAILKGSCQAGEAAEVVFCHLDDPLLYSAEEFRDMDSSIRRRSFNWRKLTASEARRAMRYAGQEEWMPTRSCYLIPDDGIHQLQDCDLWIVFSDRLTYPLLPIKPIVLMVNDYQQRYVPTHPKGADQSYLDAARNATQVWVTTEFTQIDALQYAGVDACRLRRLPMLAPNLPKNKNALGSRDYFIWTTNPAAHKNYSNAMEALRIYYAELDGKLKCKITGMGSKDISVSKLSHLKLAQELLSRNETLQQNIEWLGELPDEAYQDYLSSAVFLWHAGNIDNGTFSVIEAASVGVPSLSSNYPAMREIDAQFQLNLAWMDANCPRDMAHRLKEMELQAEYCRQKLPSAQVLQSQNVEHLAGYYWNAVRECL